jgi:AraC-like DNA-binding protein
MRTEKKFKRHVLQAVIAYKELLDIHCCNGDPALQLSAQFGVSRNVLQIGFKKLYGENIREYKLRKRMERSRLLLDSGHDVKDVARTLNYAESRAFTSAFKKYFGHTPSIFYELVE